MNKAKTRKAKSKTIYFHMGTVKTGSTSIQKFCHENTDFLSNNDLAYPHITHPDLHLPRYANAGFLWREESHDGAQRALASLAESRVLISEEGLIGSPSKINLPIFDDFQKRVIIYIRPPADLIAAWASEKCKPYTAAGALSNGPGLLSIEKAILHSLGDYMICMDKVITELRALGTAHVTVRPYEHSQLRGASIVDDFLGTFNIGSIPPSASARVNESPTRKFCDVAQLVWTITEQLGVAEAYFDESLVHEVYRNCGSGDMRPVVDTLPDTVIERICEKLAYLEEILSAEFLEGRPLFHQRFPHAYGTSRVNYRPPDPSEVSQLTRSAINGRFVPW